MPFSLLSHAARSSRPKRGRPRQHPTPLSVPAEASAQQEVSPKDQPSTQKLRTNINVNEEGHYVTCQLPASTGTPDAHYVTCPLPVSTGTPDAHRVTCPLPASTGTPDADKCNSPKLRRSKRLAAASFAEVTGKMRRTSPDKDDASGRVDDCQVLSNGKGRPVRKRTRQQREKYGSDLCSDDDEPGGQLLGESTTGEGGNDDEEDDDDDDDDGAEGVKDSGGQRPSGGGGSEKKKNTSAIILHLLSNPVCRESYDDSWFSVVRSASSFRQFKVLEAVYIRIRDPNLCKQKRKKNVTTLTLFQ